MTESVVSEEARLPRYLAALAAMVFVLKIGIALSTQGSTDVLIFEADLAKMRREGAVALYRDGISTPWCGQLGQRECPPFIHPPFMIHALAAWGALADVSGLPLRFWLRLTCAIADVGSLALVLRMRGARRQEDVAAWTTLALFTACPISILVSGFHGNTDPILMFFVLLSIFLVESRRPAWQAGVALGMAMNVKILPALLVPVVLLGLSRSRRRVEFCAGAAAVVLLASLPILAAAPEVVVPRVSGYSSQSGSWGISLLALSALQIQPLAWLYDLSARYGKVVSVGLVVIASWWPGPRYRESALFLRIGFLLFLFLAVTPGFGAQYLVWLVPWVVALGVGPTAAYYVVGAFFLFAYYTAAAGGFPWDLANSLEHPPWTATVLGLGLICWLVICRLTLRYARTLWALPAERPCSGDAAPGR